jgi:ComF family protein
MLKTPLFITDMVGLLFPNLCNACGIQLYRGESLICTKCLYNLPYTDYHLHAENRVAKQLWGRLPFNAAMAMLYFKKGNTVQNLIHSLKYKNQTGVGLKLGNLLGEKLALGSSYEGIDLIIPVPLHQKKEKSRGYNQSKYIADGIAEVLKVPVCDTVLQRNTATATQTKKTRYTRYENMKAVFTINQAEQISGKHVLLVDDVITTGATLEACGLELIDAGVLKISIAALAFAE